MRGILEWLVFCKIIYTHNINVHFLGYTYIRCDIWHVTHIQCIYFTCNVMLKVHFYVVVPHRSAGNGTVAMALAIYYFAMFNFYFLLFLSHRLLPSSNLTSRTHKYTHTIHYYYIASPQLQFQLKFIEQRKWHELSLAKHGTQKLQLR